MAWFLEYIARDGSRVTRAVRTLPFTVGRDAANHLVDDAPGLSRRHARIDVDAAGRLCITDLNSTNGTFVNRERLQGTRLLKENDIIHFGGTEYRLASEQDAGEPTSPGDSERTMIAPIGRVLSAQLVPERRQFLELLREGRGLAVAAQPIVDAHSREIFAYEMLARCTHPELNKSPTQLFEMAAKLGYEADLSEAFRNLGLKAMAPMLNGRRVFINAHPKETFEEGFMDSLRALRERPDPPRLVVEVHETAVMEIERMRELAVQLKSIGVDFAYDDFGAGQARLNEISEVPADFVKFDMGLLHGIHEAGERKQRVVHDLVRTVREMGSVTLAEGIELEAEAVVCREMGFQLIQGYLTGKPVLMA